MSIRSWLRSAFTRPAARTIRKATRRPRLTLEVLEDRAVPATFTVGSLLDAPTTGMPGVITLREAIDATHGALQLSDLNADFTPANVSGPLGTGTDTIVFDPS